jgi:hypothetical protein
VDERRIEYLSLDEITGAARNPKKTDETGIRRSIERFGFATPALRDEPTGRVSRTVTWGDWGDLRHRPRAERREAWSRQLNAYLSAAAPLRLRPAAHPQVGPSSRFTLAAVRFEDLLERVEVRGDRGLYSRSRQRRDEPQRA